MKLFLAVIGGLCLLAFRLSVGGAFLLAAFMKLREPQEFADTVKAFRVLPEELDHIAVVATFGVPWLEVFAGLALVLGFWTRSAAALVGALLVGFIGLIISVIARPEISIACGCFGEVTLFCDGAIGWCNVAQNSVMLLLVLLTLVWGGGLFSLDRVLEGGRRKGGRKR